MVELVVRERQEKMATWELMTTAMGAFFGHNTDTIRGILRPLRDALSGEVFQTDYSSDKLLMQLKTRLHQVKNAQDDIERLNNMNIG